MSTNGAPISPLQNVVVSSTVHPMPAHAGPSSRPRRPVRFGALTRLIRPIQLALVFGVLTILLLPACSTTRGTTEGPRFRLDRQTIAVMSAANEEEAERLRLELLRGQPPPPSAHLVSIEELVRTNPALGNVAAQLMDCEVSRTIAPPVAPTDAQTGTDYLVLQRGGDPDQPCHGEANMGDQIAHWGDKAGELLVSLLAIGVAGFLAAAPFIFHIF
jgi:hypothetical protein